MQAGPRMHVGQTAGNGGSACARPGEVTEGVAALVEILRGRRVTVLTGAGCSTESGIPDYRSPRAGGRPRPVQYREFLSTASVRTRYWARSMVGWPAVASARPNPAHTALAELERRGIVRGLITQNVDGLHHRAGSRQVVELHGSLARVRCMKCGGIESRAGLQERLLGLNPDHRGRVADSAPDGDARIPESDLDAFRVPGCRTCDRTLKPDVVFFGENIPKAWSDAAWASYESGEVLLVVGSSLAVFSGYRFVLRARKDRRPIAIVNMGETRGDDCADLKVEGRVGKVLPLVLDALTGGPAGRARADG